jgi:hypothetical protein
MSIENMGIIIHMVLNMSVPLTNILLRNTGTTCTGAARLFEDVSICVGTLPDFDGMNKRYAPALRARARHLTSFICSELEQALSERERVLARLHKIVQRGDESAHEHLWEVQRIVTLIRRHLRNVQDDNTQYTEASMYAKLAINAMLYEDAKAAVDNLRNALNLIDGARHSRE